MKCDGGVRRYLSQHELGICSLLAGACFIAFMTLLPLLVDPSIVTFVLNLEPASCLTLYSVALNGTSNCSWTSCQEGCTVDIYKCWHINVSYSLRNPRNNVPSATLELARLYPNVVGCGYPPIVNCDEFFRNYGRTLGKTFPCFVSLTDPSVAVIHVDFQEAAINLSLGFVPLIVFVSVIVYVILRLRCKRRWKQTKAAQAALNEAEERKRRIEESKRLLANRKQSWINAFRLDRISASSSPSHSLVDVDKNQPASPPPAAAVRNFMMFKARSKKQSSPMSTRGSNSSLAVQNQQTGPISTVSALVVSPSPLPRLVVNT